VCAVAFASESQVIGGYGNGDIRRWSIEDGQQLGQTVQAVGLVLSIAVSQDGRWVVSGDHGRQATIWNALTNEKVRHTEYGNSMYAVDISSNSTKVVAASFNTTDNVQLFDITSGTELLSPISHGWTCGVKFSPDGSQFATASNVCGVRVYSTHNGSILFDSGTRGSTNSPSVVTSFTWSSDGQQLFVASAGKITSFNISDSSSSEWLIHGAQFPVSIASKRKFIACSACSSISLWDCMSHRQIGSIITHSTVVKCIALLPRGRFLACELLDGKITIHDLREVLPSKCCGSGISEHPHHAA
ncbi:hypothetical protein PISMIDRAFT_115337, partial [Pisolithus microcarpus 441]